MHAKQQLLEEISGRVYAVYTDLHSATGDCNDRRHIVITARTAVPSP